ncbi:phage tail protein [Pandoraea commovens]|uniref:Phage tail protein n=1 Tax=Pandoraea commovens TaxID=2508289 RepID=A0ABY5QL06_9BURK|nr:phage tail protein [Pandoraea commovens]UVA80513.1 phage tail protein [Pandoraea commovens]
MTATFYTIATDIGNAKEANAIALGLRRKFVALAVGDGGGDNAPIPTPKPNQKALLGEWRRAPLNSLEPDPKNPSQLIAEQIIPENEGGKWIREMALIDEDGDLCYISNAPPTYKPLLPEGSGKTQGLRMVIIVSNVGNVELKIDPSVVLATREYADKAITVAMKAHSDADDPHSQYAKKTVVAKSISDAFAAHVGDADPHQQYASKSKTPLVFSILDLPTKNIGPISVAECGEIWIWSASDYFTGYRSPLCGRPVDGHTLVPLASEIDAVGGLVSKSDYARLWGYAKENNLVVPQATWDNARGAHFFVDVSGTQFRVPDLRNMFRRYMGTDADTANARTLGTRQSDQFKRHSHSPGSYVSQSNTPSATSARIAMTSDTYWVIPSQDAAEGGTETRATNTAYAPRIHV